MIEGLPNQVVHLNTRSKRLELEKCGLSTTCTCDSLEVFDGLMYNASMGKWCETELNVLSSGRFLKLIFTSNEDTSGGGFELEYVILNKSKGNHINNFPMLEKSLSRDLNYRVKKVLIQYSR